MKGLIVFAWLLLAAIPGFSQQDGRATRHVFPQVVDGKDGFTHYRSTIYIQNVSTSRTNNSCAFTSGFEVALTTTDGRQSDSSSLHRLELPPDGWLMATTLGTQPLKRGYASLTCTDMTTAQVVFSFYGSSANGAATKIGEATVQSTPGGRMVQLLSDGTDGARLGIAIANDTNIVSTIRVKVFDDQDQLIRTALFTAEPLSSGAFFLDYVFQDLPPGHRGRVLFEATSPINVTGLRFTGAVFTTIPATIRAQ